MRIKKLVVMMGVDELLTAFDLAVEATPTYNLDFERLRKGFSLQCLPLFNSSLIHPLTSDVCTLLLRQPTLTPQQKKLILMCNKDVSRLISCFLLLHNLFFAHFVRSEVFVFYMFLHRTFSSV